MADATWTNFLSVQNYYINRFLLAVLEELHDLKFDAENTKILLEQAQLVRNSMKAQGKGALDQTMDDHTRMEFGKFLKSMRGMLADPELDQKQKEILRTALKAGQKELLHDHDINYTEFQSIINNNPDISPENKIAINEAMKEYFETNTQNEEKTCGTAIVIRDDSATAICQRVQKEMESRGILGLNLVAVEAGVDRAVIMLPTPKYAEMVTGLIQNEYVKLHMLNIQTPEQFFIMADLKRTNIMEIKNLTEAEVQHLKSMCRGKDCMCTDIPTGNGRYSFMFDEKDFDFVSQNLAASLISTSGYSHDAGADLIDKENLLMEKQLEQDVYDMLSGVSDVKHITVDDTNGRLVHIRADHFIIEQDGESKTIYANDFATPAQYEARLMMQIRNQGENLIYTVDGQPVNLRTYNAQDYAKEVRTKGEYERRFVTWAISKVAAEGQSTADILRTVSKRIPDLLEEYKKEREESIRESKDYTPAMKEKQLEQLGINMAALQTGDGEAVKTHIMDAVQSMESRSMAPVRCEMERISHMTSDINDARPAMDRFMQNIEKEEKEAARNRPVPSPDRDR